MEYYSRPALKQQARSRMRTTKPSVFVATIIYFVISIILGNLTARLSGITDLYSEMYQRILSGESFDYFEFVSQHMPHVGFFPGLLILVIALMIAMLAAGYMGYCLKVSRGDETRFMDIFRSFDHFGTALGIAVLQWIYIFLWTLLLVIPGIIAAYRYSQAYYIMYDHPEYSAARCLRESSLMMKGRKWELFVLDLSFIGWRILNSILSAFVGIGFLDIYIQPFYGITRAEFYNLFSANGNRADAPPVWEGY